MSSGPFMYTLTAAAACVLRSFMEKPDLQTREEIANKPHLPPALPGARLVPAAAEQPQ
jgi:hypothetical protein